MALSSEDLEKIDALFGGRIAGLESKVGDLVNSMASVTVRLVALETSSTKLETGFETLKASSTKLETGFETLKASSTKLETGFETLKASSTKLETGFETLETGNRKINTRLEDLERTAAVVNRFPYPQEPRRHVHREIKTHSASGPTYR